MAPSESIISAQLVREREWAWSAFLAGVSPHQARAAALEALGYELSPDAFRGLVEGYRAANGMARVDREARIEQQLYTLDEQQRTLKRLIAARERGDATALDLDGRKELRAVMAEIAKLEGLYAPTKVEADVSVYDGASTELAKMLAEAGIEQAADA